MRSLLDRLSRSPSSLIFLGALIFQILVLSRHAASHHLVPASDDMKFYLDWGMRIAGGEWTDRQSFYGLPGYAYWLGALLILTSRDAVATSLITGALQALAFAAVVSLIFVLSRESLQTGVVGQEKSGTDKTAAVAGCLAAAAWTFFVPAQAYSVILMPTVGAVLAYWFGVHFLSKVSERTALCSWLCLGLLVGITALFIATVFFLLPLACFAILRAILQSNAPRRVFRGVVAAVLLFGGVLGGTSPAWLHNTFIAKDPVLLSAHSGINMWIGNNPVANGYPKIPQGLRSGQEGLLRDSLLIPQEAAGRPLRRSEISQYWNSKARKWIGENPGTWLRLVGTKLVNFWNAFQYDDINVLRLLKSDGVPAGFSSFGIISALGLAGIPLVVWILPYSRWVVAGVLLHMLALIPVFVTERYRLAAVPGLLVCGSLGAFLLWRALATKRWTTAIAYILLVCSAAALVSLPKGDAGAWALSHYNMGVRTLAIAEQARAMKETSLAAKEYARSQRELEVAFAYAPGSTEINLALGNLWHSKGDTSRAKLFYERVIAIEPRHLSALNNRGVVALEEQQWELASRCFERALGADPNSAKSYYLLAKAKLGASDVRSARAAIEKALQLQPNQKEFLSLEEQLRIVPR